MILAAAEQVKRIVSAGHYTRDGRKVDLAADIAACLHGTRLVRPGDWDGLIARALDQCRQPGGRPATLEVTAETTLAAMARLAADADAAGLAALNFASARRPGGGWDTGARAQEESIARGSALVASLMRCPEYYAANRAHPHLFYTEHAIWSPAVPCFMDDDGDLLAAPYRAGIITMPAPNIGAMRPSEADLLALPGVWRRRIACVLALAIAHGVRRIVLGAWGCGAFRNDPLLVARWFREVLAEPGWMNGFQGITFAIHDSARGQPCLRAFRGAFAEEAEGP